MVILFILIQKGNIIMTTTTTNAKLVNSYEEFLANFFSRISEERKEEVKAEIFKNGQQKLEELYKSLDSNFSVETFNTVLEDNVSEELFNNPDALRRYLKEEGFKSVAKIRSFIKNENPNALDILNWMEGVIKEQASDIARIVEARLK